MLNRHTGNLTPKGDNGAAFDVCLKVDITDAALLWRMAAAHALAVSALEMEDIEEVIGPMEDPSLADCLAMLLVPQSVAGCALTDVRIERVPVAPSASRSGSKRRSVQAVATSGRVVRATVP